MSAWGKTGRVVLGAERSRSWPVLVDGERVGTAWKYIARPGGLAYGSTDGTLGPDQPSLDAAVMWVLRRAAPDVWRAERGPVWQVMHCGSPNFRGGPGWDAWLPGSDRFGHYHTHADAMKAATR